LYQSVCWIPSNRLKRSIELFKLLHFIAKLICLRLNHPEF